MILKEKHVSGIPFLIFLFTKSSNKAVLTQYYLIRTYPSYRDSFTG